MIKRLSENKIRQIAAGEVISKPYNAVKELIENSIDAKANQIQLIFKEYGMESIIIIDNGTGIKKEELKLAKEIHTTSKTSESESIFGINYLGFRGEALASIDAISNLIIESNGFKLENEEIKESILKKGTKISVINLFKNIPARLKFIKDPKSEFKLIKDLIKKYMIQYNEISWSILSNGKQLWNLDKQSKEERIQSIFREKSLIKNSKEDSIKITAYIFRKNNNVCLTFVNKRIIKDKAIFKYLTVLFKEYSFLNEHPGYILDITIDPLFVDFNVHPSKEEVKFLNYNKIFSLLHSIFSMNNLVYEINTSYINFFDHTQKKNSFNKLETILEQTKLNEHIMEESNILKPEQSFTNFDSNDVDSKTLISKKEKIEKYIIEPVFKLIGQLKNSYILFETEEGFGIFDQHAAHERNIYEDMKKFLSKEYSQKLISPINLFLTTEREIFLKDNKKTLQQKGIYIENQKIISLPSIFKNIDDVKLSLESIPIPCDISTHFDRLIANIACKKALKANTSLSLHQMHSLLQSALICPPVCNHGRPVFKYFSENEIKNFFKRT